MKDRVVFISTDIMSTSQSILVTTVLSNKCKSLFCGLDNVQRDWMQEVCLFPIVALTPPQSHQHSWLRFGTLDHIVFIWKYFSCISATLKGDEDKGQEGGKNTPCCVNPRVGLEPCHSSLSLHQLSLIAREDRRPRARLFLILFGAFWGMKSERPAFDLFFFLFFFSPFLSSSAILSLRVTHSFHTVPPSPSTQNNYQAPLHQIIVEIGGHGGEGQRSGGVGPRTWWSSQLILEACSLALATFIYLDPGFRLPVLMRPSHAAKAMLVLH